MKKIFTLMLSMAMVAGAQAQTVSPKVAAQKAAGLFQKSSAAKGMAAQTVAEPQLAYVSVLNGDTCFYVFNNPQGGFAIIGGDRVAREVLATVDNGSFDINKLPSNMKFMLEQYAINISEAKSSVITENTPTWSFENDIPMIMQTKWDQDAPYNNKVPLYRNSEGQNERCATGCVATAAAQAVYTALKGKFTKGKNSKVYEHTVTNADKTTVKKEQTFDALVDIKWDMNNTYTKSDVGDAADNVAEWMKTMGVISQMSYGESSGTGSEILQRGLYNNLNIAAKYLNQKDAGKSDQEWEQIIYNELATGRPVIYGADTGTGAGHEFVLDGYQKTNDNFHVNWGWGGSCDGWYALSSAIATANGHDNGDSDKGTGSWMFPAEQGTGGSGETTATAKGSAYRLGYEIVYNLVMRDEKSRDMPEFNASDATPSQESSSTNAKGMTTTDITAIPNIYVGDGTAATSDYKMHISFGEEGTSRSGNNAILIWGVLLEPVFDGEEPDEYDCPILDATNGKGDETMQVEMGVTVYGYDIPVGEYSWNETGKATKEGEPAPYKAGKYTVTPIMYFDADDDNQGYISDENIVYVGMPYGWKAPTANFILGAKTTTAIDNANVNANKSAKAVKVIRKNRIVVEKDGKQFSAVGQQM